MKDHRMSSDALTVCAVCLSELQAAEMDASRKYIPVKHD